jgi:hypothetical protein
MSDPISYATTATTKPAIRSMTRISGVGSFSGHRRTGPKNLGGGVYTDPWAGTDGELRDLAALTGVR